MSRKIHLGRILGIGLCFGLFAETIEAGQAGSGTACGQEIRAKDVLVLDLERMRRLPEMAQDFADEQAGDFRLLLTGIEEIRTRSRHSKDPDSLIRGARKLRTKRGCDLVLVLKTGPYFGRQRNVNGRISERGYAFVVIGQSTANIPHQH